MWRQPCKAARRPFFVTLSTLVLLVPVAVRPHAAVLWAEVREGGQVVVEGYFSDGSRVKGRRVLVQDARDDLLLEGTTDANGEFSFTPNRPQELTIRLELDQAHGDAVTLSREAF